MSRQTITVAKDQLPECIRTYIPSDRIDVTLCTEVTLHSTQWDGGTRNVYRAIHLGTGEIKSLHDTRPWPQNMQAMDAVTIPEGCIILQTGTFCGRTSAGHIYARAGDVTPALPKPVDVALLPHHLQQVLKAIAEYNSKGREGFRSDVGMSKEKWALYLSFLVERGLCKPNSRLTVAGENLARTIDSMILNPYSDKFKG